MSRLDVRACVAAIAAIAALGGAVIAFPACAGQMEGEVCNLLAGQNKDCDGTLVCTDPKQLSGVVATADQNIGRCCPPDRAFAKADICKLPLTPDGGSTTIPANPSTSDAGSADTGAADAGAADAAQGG